MAAPHVYTHQVAGHVVYKHADCILKPLVELEGAFYEAARWYPRLQAILPLYKGIYNDKGSRKDERLALCLRVFDASRSTG